MNLLNVIPYGKENAISRSEIVRITGINDRAIRLEIKALNAELTKHGEAILSSSSSKGYWRTANVQEMKHYLSESRHRRERIYRNDEPIQKLVYETEGIKQVFVRSHFRRVNPKLDKGQVYFNAE